MDLGKIMIGTALVLLAAGMVISPSAAATGGSSCKVGCGSCVPVQDATVTPYSPPERVIPAEYRASFCGITGPECTTTLRSLMEAFSPGMRHAPV